jgi:hypothetical protein
MSLAGCLKATGGGKLTGQNNGGTITMGFQMRCEDVGPYGHVTGELQYNDHTMNVAFHAVIDTTLAFGDPLNPLYVTCEELDNNIANYGFFSTLATYTPYPRSVGLGGHLQISIQDQYKSLSICKLTGVDAMAVQIIDGVYGRGGMLPMGQPYAEQGCLDKGNFTVFTE